ncbi:MAG TPA: DUF695 domain-containing protein [Flavisolibacter sp.]|nr:DUF695 domain-containing protein [Flavisolibacter sp.]
MKRILLLPVFLFSYCVLHAQAAGQWDTYMSMYEKGPGTVLIDLGLKTSLPDKELPFLLETGVRFTDCTSDGLPAPTAFDQLYLISDSVNVLVSLAVESKMAGTFTYQCERKDYYYISDTTGLRKKLEQLYTRRFPNSAYSIVIRADAGWKTYTGFLYPDEETFEYMQNTKLVMKLEEAGDKLSTPRKVDHWLYFRDEKGRAAFASKAREKGYAVEEQTAKGPASSPYQLHLSRIDKVELGSITRLTLQLRKEANQYGGQYDGWETAVTK